MKLLNCQVSLLRFQFERKVVFYGLLHLEKCSETLKINKTDHFYFIDPGIYQEVLHFEIYDLGVYLNLVRIIFTVDSIQMT